MKDDSKEAKMLSKSSSTSKLKSGHAKKLSSMSLAQAQKYEKLEGIVKKFSFYS